MTPLSIFFTLLASLSLLIVRRRWAPVPLLTASCYMTLGQMLVIGPFHFSVIRILLAVAITRIIMKREYPAGGLCGVDRLLIVWAAWALFSSAFHREPYDAFINRLGLVYNTLGVYFLLRSFIEQTNDVAALVKVTAFILLPVALEMLIEQFTHRNLFSALGAVPEEVYLRGDRFRSQGPFRHPILAGTVGAVCAPLMVGIWRLSPLTAKIGLTACLLMVVTSASSGPLMSLFFSILGLFLWRWRHLTRQMRIAAVLGYLLLDLVMKAPAYYLIARIDLVGGSTGYHRSRLIESAFQHLGEWWWAGTDYTLHWMPTGVTWSPEHTDITNHYIKMGVLGGLPLMVFFVLILCWGFYHVGKALRARIEAPITDQFLVWSLGASLFSHAVTCISVSYFDQSFLFLYLTLAMIVSVSTSRAEESAWPVGDSLYGNVSYRSES